MIKERAMDEEYSEAQLLLRKARKEEELRSMIKQAPTYRNHIIYTSISFVIGIAASFAADNYELFIKSSRWTPHIVFIAVIAFGEFIWLLQRVAQLEKRIYALIKLLDVETFVLPQKSIKTTEPES
jgi:hypothetical protein